MCPAPPLAHRVCDEVPQAVLGTVEDAAMDAEDLGRAKGQDGALDGGYRAMSTPDRRDQLVYLFGEGGDLLRHPPVAAPLQRPPG